MEHSSIRPSYRQSMAVLSLVALLGGWFASKTAVAQGVDFFGGQAASFHADLTRYFATPESEMAARLELQGRTNAYLKVAFWTPEDAATQLKEGAKLLTNGCAMMFTARRVRLGM